MLGLITAICAVGVATIAALTTVDMGQIDLSWVMAGLTAAASAIAFGFTSLEV